MLYEVITIFDYESGKKIPDDLTLKKLANALFTTVSFFSDENKQIVSLSIERADGSYVITSYSIHYTKLYDCGRSLRELRRSRPGPREGGRPRSAGRASRRGPGVRPTN